MNRILLLPVGLLFLFLPAAFGQTELIVNGGFEQGNTGWAVFQAGARSNPTIPHSGANNLVMGNINGTTANPTLQTVYQTIAIPTNTVNGQLTYWYNIYSTFGGNNQQFTVYIATNNNIGTLAALIDNRDASSPDSAQDSAHYHQVIFTNLAQFAGQTIQLVFATRMVEFGGLTFFNVDDVSLVVATTADLAPNDNFASRTVITNFSTNVSAKTTFATKEPGEPNHGGNAGGHSVWWSFTAPTNGIMTLNAFSGTFDTLLGVYTGDSVTNLTLIVGTNSLSTSDAVSRLRLPVYTGTEYEIAVDGANGGAGMVNLLFTFQQDTNPPVVTILSPSPGQKVTNSTVTVRGTAIDNVGVEVVQYRLENSAGTNGYIDASGTTVWTGTLNDLIPGTNTLRVIAYDTNGNLSASVSRSFSYVIVAPLTLLTTGVGTLTPNYSNALLEIGRNYTITAKPGTGYVFSNWTGDVSSTLATLTFTMQSNLTLQANFVPTPYPAGKGNYAGLFYPADIAYTNSGFFSAAVTDKGKFTSKIQIAGKTYPLAGQFGVDGSFSNSVRRLNLSALSVQLLIDFSGGDVITGTLSDGTWVSPLTANRDTFSRTNPPPYAGRKFTLVIPGSDDSSTQPGGHGFGNGMVDPIGNIIFAGTLGDGTKFNQRTFLSKDGQWPFFAMPYAGKGLLLGWLAFDTNQPSGDLGGPVNWIKLPQLTGKYYRDGFDLAGIETVGSFYTFSTGTPILNWTNGMIVLQEGNLGDSITNSLTIGANNKVTGTNNLVLSFVPATGLFHGSVKNPATGKPLPVNGAVLQKQENGFGTFLGTNQTGQVFLGSQ